MNGLTWLNQRKRPVVALPRRVGPTFTDYWLGGVENSADNTAKFRIIHSHSSTSTRAQYSHPTNPRDSLFFHFFFYKFLQAKIFIKENHTNAKDTIESEVKQEFRNVILLTKCLILVNKKILNCRCLEWLSRRLKIVRNVGTVRLANLGVIRSVSSITRALEVRFNSTELKSREGGVARREKQECSTFQFVSEFRSARERIRGGVT